MSLYLGGFSFSDEIMNTWQSLQEGTLGSPLLVVIGWGREEGNNSTKGVAVARFDDNCPTPSESVIPVSISPPLPSCWSGTVCLLFRFFRGERKTQRSRSQLPPHTHTRQKNARFHHNVGRGEEAAICGPSTRLNESVEREVTGNRYTAETSCARINGSGAGLLPSLLHGGTDCFDGLLT